MSISHDDYDFYPHTDVSNISQRVIISGIISITFVFALVLALHIYARIILRHQARQERGTLDFRVSQLFVLRGLDPKVIASLPIFKFKQLDGGDRGKDECAVCLSVLGGGELARILPNCKHIFHAECIDRWLSNQSTCPVCRTEATPRPMPEPREPPAGGSTMVPPLAMEEGWTSNGRVQSFGGMFGGSSFRLSSFTRITSSQTGR
ncbi:hypothetical protein Dimus_009523 [Dionaea muscipula]